MSPTVLPQPAAAFEVSIVQQPQSRPAFINWRMKATQLLRMPLSLQGKLSAIGALMSVGMALTSVVAGFALVRTQAVTQEVVRQATALSLLQNADMVHDALRADVLSAFLVGQVKELQADAVRKDLKENLLTMRELMTRLAALDYEPERRAELLSVRPVVDRYLDVAESTVSSALAEGRAAQERLPAFNAAFDLVFVAFEKQIEALRALNLQAVNHAERVKLQAGLTVLGGALATMALLVLLVARIGRSIRESLQRVQCVAAGVAGGDLGRRAEVQSADEVGRLGEAVNSMADKLQDMLSQARSDAERHSFGHELNEALEMADSEPETYTVIQRAMAAVASDRPMELLVADNSQAVLQRATEHPHAGSPGCGVDSPFSCQAVRRGNTVSFPNSEALNACPRLRGRPGAKGAISAVCVPLHFMGRALGVLHASGPADQSLLPVQMTQLGTIGIQAAARIGVVRAFERTQMQAATDSATGLANRRALEASIHELMRRGQPFAFVMADLDRFKMLNDTYGHLVGDEALRLFADTMKKAVRDHDVVARWGGEEFAFVLSGSTARQGLDWAERARGLLAKALEGNKVPKFTVSFGIADSTMATQLEDMLRLADEALYRSKEQGRDRATLATSVAANEPAARQASEHEGKIDPSRLVGSA